MSHSATAASPRVASIEAVRAQFPALSRLHNNFPVAYFDGPGGTQVPQVVADAMSNYLLHHNANTHWVYPTSAETDAMLLDARIAMADLLGASETEIAFGNNMTTLLFHVSRAIGRTMQPGDEIIVTELDHHANIAPWQALARERGAVLKWLPLDLKTYRHEEGAFEKLLSPRTKIVAIGAASNILGTITDVAPMIAAARAHGAISVIDAVHCAPHALVDVQKLGCDFLLCSAYKFYGPHVGVCYGRFEAMSALDLPRLEPAPSVAPESLETGTQNHEGIVGTGAAVNFLASIAASDVGSRRERLIAAYDVLHARGESLLEQMWNGLSSINGVTMFGPPPGSPRTPTVSFVVRNMDSETIARALVPLGVFVSNGDFYASTVARRLGYASEGVVRAGCSCYTSADEVARLVDGVKAIAASAR